MAAMPADDMPPLVTPCFRCGGPVENPIAGMGHVLGEERDRLPLCLDCLGRLLDPYTRATARHCQH